jgi:hypothetical protein
MELWPTRGQTGRDQSCGIPPFDPLRAGSLAKSAKDAVLLGAKEASSHGPLR